MVENLDQVHGTMLCVVIMDGTDVQGKFSMVKHSWLAKICGNHESFPPGMI